jgi:hypothetical protein
MLKVFSLEMCLFLIGTNFVVYKDTLSLWTMQNFIKISFVKVNEEINQNHSKLKQSNI